MEQTIDNNQPNKRIAAIDLGTNSFHAVIVDIYPDGSFRTVDKLKEMVILAEKGMENHLSEEAMDRGLEALKRIRFLCDSQQVEEILAYATSAIREAENGGDFIQRSLYEAGVKVQVISGKMEAEMIGLAVRHSIAIGDEMVLMVDIGGGSVEFIVGNDKEFVYSKSLKLGVARMAARFVDADPVSKENIKKLEQHFEKELSAVSEIVKKHKVKTVIGSSGTMENIAAMIAGKNASDTMISLNEYTYGAKAFQKFYKKFIQLDKSKRLELKTLEEKRVDIINPGVILVKYLLDEFGIENVKISEGALRDGMIIDFIKKEKGKYFSKLNIEFKDPRKRSIHELLRKCNWLEDHSRHVAKMALQIFDEFKSELKLNENDRELLEYSAFLHDIGYYISYSRHHKHALYIIKNSELRGFTDDEVNIMANVARYHRNSTPKKRHKAYKSQSKPVRKRIKKLSAILRVADGLDRSHFQNVQKLEIDNQVEKVVFNIYTESDPELEVWGGMRKAKLLKKQLNKKIEIKAFPN
ncbi:Ppx/GppA phosphatase family protein [Gramella sp. AN32]|uniref:HD domain-containing protein n=1 Tax=Christiangramia antarctica TaxID=2058158 RepID=A0ABW5WZT7_9FLAO|nr:Ppx/GppA phosphatase family protein [Gramella sp. AN32]MCM4155687.1 Ppx/GppA family phosphatase [Gramella sp. AN32]